LAGFPRGNLSWSSFSLAVIYLGQGLNLLPPGLRPGKLKFSQGNQKLSFALEIILEKTFFPCGKLTTERPPFGQKIVPIFWPGRFNYD
jgi:hypothetical protein